MTHVAVFTANLGLDLIGGLDYRKVLSVLSTNGHILSISALNP